MLMTSIKNKARKTGGTVRLDSEDREFLSRLTESMYLNPFSEELELIRKLIPDYTPEQFRTEHFLWTVKPLLNQRIEQLESKGIHRIQQLQGKDRTLVEDAFKLQAYLRVVPEMDKLVQPRSNREGSSIEVPFGRQVVNQIKSRGFSEQEGVHFFALFYQLRRAYYFISHSLTGDSPSMKKLRLALWNNVFSYNIHTYDQFLVNRMEDFSTLLLGATGTGKGSAAAAIGRSGYIPFDLKKGQFTKNFNDIFIAINLSQYSESLIESELFGHCKGAFTGAVENHQGLFERCTDHGSLFLDEIGELSVPIQIKLLHVLQERIFDPVGSHNQKRFAGRVIAATNRPLQDLRKRGNFRDDFFYRLSSDVITVPNLSQRIEESPDELAQLVNLLVTRMTGQKSSSLTEMILEKLKRDLPPNYSWPGNVRELEQAIRRILLTGKYGGDLFVSGLNVEEDFVQKFQTGDLDARDLLSQYCTLLFNRFGTYEEVARRTKLDRRTVKKYLSKTDK
ncbi:MAG: sigma 54-interacting transcriptional regulator [Nitrospinota bacterium]|nr:sigma 54-interacting transcriptional regulator [Nitrospinota bacterium]